MTTQEFPLSKPYNQQVGWSLHVDIYNQRNLTRTEDSKLAQSLLQNQESCQRPIYVQGTPLGGPSCKVPGYDDPLTRAWTQANLTNYLNWDKVILHVHYNNQ